MWRESGGGREGELGGDGRRAKGETRSQREAAVQSVSWVECMAVNSLLDCPLLGAHLLALTRRYPPSRLLPHARTLQARAPVRLSHCFARRTFMLSLTASYELFTGNTHIGPSAISSPAALGSTALLRRRLSPLPQRFQPFPNAPPYLLPPHIAPQLIKHLCHHLSNLQQQLVMLMPSRREEGNAELHRGVGVERPGSVGNETVG